MPFDRTSARTSRRAPRPLSGLVGREASRYFTPPPNWQKRPVSRRIADSWSCRRYPPPAIANGATRDPLLTRYGGYQTTPAPIVNWRIVSVAVAGAADSKSLLMAM